MQACAALLATTLLALPAQPPAPAGPPDPAPEWIWPPDSARMPVQPAADTVTEMPPLGQQGPAAMSTCPVTAPGIWPHMVWGEADAKLFPDAGRIAPNGVAYDPLFSLDLDFNIWLWPSQGLYYFADLRYWGGRGGQGQTHGNIDYTRREFDLMQGVAWNYCGPLELRAVGYANENFNRGSSEVSPDGHTNDGFGVEQRLYLSEEYTRLGQPGYNVSRATFVSLGYYPTKSLIGGDGKQFAPGLFARLNLIWDIPSTCCYLYGNFYQVFERPSFVPRMLFSDVGLAITPFKEMPMLEFRLGSEFDTDWRAAGAVRNMSLPYLSVRLNY
jgi:hypothetical protein